LSHSTTNNNSLRITWAETCRVLSRVLPNKPQIPFEFWKNTVDLTCSEKGTYSSETRQPIQAFGDLECSVEISKPSAIPEVTCWKTSTKVKVWLVIRNGSVEAVDFSTYKPQSFISASCPARSVTTRGGYFGS